jgi:hypothetical protein
VSSIHISLALVFILISLFLFLLLELNPFATNQNPLKKRRLYLAGTKLKIAERIAIHFTTLFRHTRCTRNKFLVMMFAAAAGGFVAGMLLFSSTDLAAIMSVCLIPAPYFYLTVKSATAAREEIEGLESTISIISNAYAGNDDIIKAVELYVEGKNRYIPANLRITTPFDEFISEIKFVNPNVEHGLYRLSAKIKNRYVNEWVKMLILCHNDRRLKFALFPIVKAMNDGKNMQVESDGMMVRVWRDYLATAGLMFSVIPMMRFSNAEWFFLLTQTAIGKLLIVLMLLSALATAFYVMRATKPSNR